MARHRAARRRANRLGRWAETLCVWRLRFAGYHILARRFASPLGEIDLVARRGKVLAFIEVKARPDAASALFAVTSAQSRRIEAAASAFLARHPRLAGLGLRYDIMLVAPRRLPRHLKDAWRPQA